MKVKVWNDNVHPYSEDFEGKLISIPARSFVEMEEDEAIMFRGRYAPIKVDFDRRHLPEGYKMIRIEKPLVKETEKKPDMYYCHACGKIEPSRKSLEAHVEENHKAQMLVEDKDEEPAPSRGRRTAKEA